jgi:hypothetical protein
LYTRCLCTPAAQRGHRSRAVVYTGDCVCCKTSCLASLLTEHNTFGTSTSYIPTSGFEAAGCSTCKPGRRSSAQRAHVVLATTHHRHAADAAAGVDCCGRALHRDSSVRQQAECGAVFRWVSLGVSRHSHPAAQALCLVRCLTHHTRAHSCCD